MQKFCSVQPISDHVLQAVFAIISLAGCIYDDAFQCQRSPCRPKNNLNICNCSKSVNTFFNTYSKADVHQLLKDSISRLWLLQRPTKGRHIKWRYAKQSCDAIN